MPGGRRNPLSMTGLIDKLSDAVHHTKDNAHDLAETTKAKIHKDSEHGPHVGYVDLVIQFIGASGIPKMDVVGTADPYFVAKLDDNISFVSNVKTNTLTPVWNETWKVKNVPKTADLHVELLDKDTGAPHDDFIGKFTTSVADGAKEVEITGPVFRRDRGTFWLKIESKPAYHPDEFPYLFDGPIRFSRHFSPTVGRLTNINDARLYSTWKMYLVGIPVFFKDVYQPWNHNYKAAQSIFQGPTSIAVRSGIQAGHRMLYARSTSNGFGVVETAADIVKILHAGADLDQKQADDPLTSRVKPAVYTYIISADDDSFRFSETGAAFFVDFASKHALHSNCAQQVRYSGEFHPRPAGGWEQFNDATPDDQVKWELVIDNNSGTYSPDPKMLPTLKALLEYNFPGFGIFALSHEDPELEKSREACRAYALKWRGVQQHQLQPHANEGEETLSAQAAHTDVSSIESETNLVSK
ncbi:hypothetical protein C8J56DRAFT_814275 [Mycena floridula]|nr:hypothetical protein C8J56DRAFT_814275 [Mycena floridula]